MRTLTVLAAFFVLFAFLGCKVGTEGPTEPITKSDDVPEGTFGYVDVTAVPDPPPYAYTFCETCSEYVGYPGWVNPETGFFECYIPGSEQHSGHTMHCEWADMYSGDFPYYPPRTGPIYIPE